LNPTGILDGTIAQGNMDELARILSASDEYRILRRYAHPGRYHEDDDAPKKIGILLDIETTGFLARRDRIIELGMVPFEFASDGRIFGILEGLDQFEDPEIPIPPEITALTGISDDDVRGKRIDDKQVQDFVTSCSLVVAHNADFDRRFVERRFPVFKEVGWACSHSQVPWRAEGMESSKLEYLAYQFGFFYPKHRATSDCLAAIHLLAQSLPRSGRPAFEVLLENARKRSVRIWAWNSPFEAKDLLKARGYTWPGDSGRVRAWYIDVDEPDVQRETEFLWNEIYRRRVELPTATIDCFKRFSDRA
jgi:DNA polymerase-3 subunit epsilon